jgi:GT2 family glycosyltransferase/peptidoglycan/xylan/chitin deacetylase (PgdA/CDA1 family)
VQEAIRENQKTAPRFSIVIPTYQRREVALRSVRALAHLQFDGRFEVIVVVDGSTDGTAEALRSLSLPFPITVIEQPNQGRATACNKGAGIAKGDLLLFLDDDMEAHPRLLSEHDRSHRAGADVVLGHVPLHEQSPVSVLTAGVKRWADKRAEDLSAADAKITLHDLITGQASLRRETFQQLGGFDARFNRHGSFGNEDLDFGYRLFRQGFRIVFNADAISWQYYVVQPRQYLRQWHQAGNADVAFARKHPDQIHIIFRRRRGLWRRLFTLPVIGDFLTGALRWLALMLVECGAQSSIASKIFFEARIIEYWRGVEEAGGIPRFSTLRVLAYHAIADLKDCRILRPYGMPPDRFECQMDTLLRAGFRFIDGDEFLRFLHHGARLPRKALLLTFDDCYEDLLTVALPILDERGIPAAAFAVTRRLGSTNDWDQAIGASQMRLLDADGLRKLVENGVEIGGHSRTHRPLTRVSRDELSEEIAGSVTDLEELRFARPRLFAYPHGEYNQGVRKATEETGLQAAFTVDPGRVRAGCDPYQIPRIEILREDVGWKFRWKIALAGRRVSFLKYVRRPFRIVRVLFPGANRAHPPVAGSVD